MSANTGASLSAEHHPRGSSQAPNHAQGCIVPPVDLVNMLPQAGAFRFIDEVLEVDSLHVVARFRFRGDEFFYPGHFPEQPITPGVILLEAMGQCGLTIHGLYLLSLRFGQEKARQHRILFTRAEVEWHSIVRPGTATLMTSELLLWRMMQLRSRVRMTDDSGALLAESTISGRAVLLDADGQPLPARVSGANAAPHGNRSASHREGPDEAG